eukprot:5017792-Pyramimonas_sp.AAC.1
MRPPHYYHYYHYYDYHYHPHGLITMHSPRYVLIFQLCVFASSQIGAACSSPAHLSLPGALRVAAPGKGAGIHQG